MYILSIFSAFCLYFIIFLQYPILSHVTYRWIHVNKSITWQGIRGLQSQQKFARGRGTLVSVRLPRDYLFIGMGHYVQTLEPYRALPFWIITRSRENMLLPIWITMRTHDLIYILICILMKWLPIDFPHCNIKMLLLLVFFFLRMAWDSNRDLLILKQLN